MGVSAPGAGSDNIIRTSVHMDYVGKTSLSANPLGTIIRSLGFCICLGVEQALPIMVLYSSGFEQRERGCGSVRLHEHEIFLNLRA